MDDEKTTKIIVFAIISILKSENKSDKLNKFCGGKCGDFLLLYFWLAALFAYWVMLVIA